MPSGFLYISSRNRLYTSSANSFEVQMNASDVFNFQQNTMTVDSIIFSNLCYPINNNNNDISFYEGVNLKTCSLTEGYYTTSTFITELQTQMNAVATNTYSAAISSSTGLLTITRTAGASQFSITTCSALNVLGFTGTDALSNGPITGAYPVNLSGTNYVDFTFNLDSYNCKTGRDIGDIFARVPVDKAYGNIITWRNENEDEVVVPGTLRNLRIEMFDEWENPYNLPYNANISIVLKMHSPDY